jgi:hypothetical protein
VVDGYKSQADVSWDQGADLCCEKVPDATTRPAAKDALRPGAMVGIRLGDRFLGLILNGVILLFVIIVSIYVTMRNRKPWWAGFNKIEGEWRI